MRCRLFNLYFEYYFHTIQLEELSWIFGGNNLFQSDIDPFGELKILGSFETTVYIRDSLHKADLTSIKMSVLEKYNDVGLLRYLYESAYI